MALTNGLLQGRPRGGVTYPKNGLNGRPFTGTPARYYFDQWKQDGTFERINASLNQLDRKRVGREAHPSVLCVDAQSVKLHPMICEYRGMDINKRVNGRKREFIVDTDGRLWVADVHAANEAEGPAAVPLVGSILWRAGERLEKVYGDQAYSGVFAQALAEWSRFAGAIDFEKASRPDSARSFLPVARRWVVELVRRCGRIVKDYEYTLLPLRRPGSVSWLYLANIQPQRRTVHATTYLTISPNLIPQHVLSSFFQEFLLLVCLMIEV